MTLSLRPFRLAGVMILALVLVAETFAQTTSALNGKVTDNNGQPLYGANVTAIHQPSGTFFGAATRSDGRYNIPGMRVGGPYTVKVSYVGFRENMQEGIVLALGEDKTVDFRMVEEAISGEAIEIVAQRNPIISESRTGVAQTISTREITNLPTLGRDFGDFTRLTPQFAGNSAAGRNNRYNTILIDGAVNNDLFGLAASGTPGGQAGTTPISLDAIQEFQVDIAPYDVRKGGFTGGGINAITRSGTNKYEASAYHFFRNESFVGEGPDEVAVANFDERISGFRVGGPILRDKLFFFVNGELSLRSSPSQFGILGNGNNNDFTGITPAMADRFLHVLDSAYGYNAGSYGVQDIETPSTKLFARLDYNITNEHRLTIRHNFVDASSDVLGRSTGTSTSSGFRTSNGGYEFLDKTNSTVLQLNSVLAKNLHNEAIIGYSTIRDSRKTVGAAFPAVAVGTGTGDLIVAGAENFSQANSLDQDIFEFTNNLTYYWGDHTFVAGTHNEFFSFENLFIRDFYGNYTFNFSGANYYRNLDSLAVGSPSAYNLSYSLDPANPKPTAKFSVRQFGFYLQDTWRAMPNLNVTVGLRFDIPVLPDKPTYNPTVDTTVFVGGSSGKPLSLNTDDVPSGNLLFSPRLGWNWDVFGDKSTQVRGGLGVFSGRTPYVWISNQYGNTGVEFGRTTTNPGPRTFTPDIANQPGKVFTAPPSEIDLTDPDFKLPQVIRLNLGVDHQLPYGIIGTFDFLLSKNQNDILYQDINLAGTSGTINLSNSGNTKGQVARWTTTPTGTTVNRIRSQYTNVIYLTNVDYGYQYSATVQLQKQFDAGSLGSFDKGYNASFAYTYGRAYDANSGTSSQAVSNWRFNPINGNPNNPPSATSNYEQRHRIVSSISYDLEFLKNYRTSISFVYLGYSGRPYSTTYSGDVNGDGQTSNDLIYVPVDRNDINIVPVTGDLRTPDEIWVQLDEYISGDPALDDARGKFIKRNASVEPWTNRVDFRLAQVIPVLENYGKFELTWDIINVMNLFNKDFGKTKFVNNQDDTPIIYRGIISGKPAFTFNAKDRFVTSDLGSRWQMQLGIRYTF